MLDARETPTRVRLKASSAVKFGARIWFTSSPTPATAAQWVDGWGEDCQPDYPDVYTLGGPSGPVVCANRAAIVRDATFCPADLTTFCRLDDLGLEVVGQQLHPDHAVLLCRVVDPDDWCHACGCLGVPRDSVLRRLAHVPLGWRATILHVRIRRYRCSGCGQVWRQDTTAAAAPRAKLSTQGVMWALKSVVIDRMSIARIAAGLGVSWHTVNDALLATGHQLLIADPTRFDGVQVLGVDEHAWRHTRRGDKFVTVIIDLTPVRDGTGPSRLLDVAGDARRRAAPCGQHGSSSMNLRPSPGGERPLPKGTLRRDTPSPGPSRAAWGTSGAKIDVGGWC